MQSLGRVGERAYMGAQGIMNSPMVSSLQSGLNAVSGLQNVAGNAQELEHQQKMAELEQQYMQGLISQEEAQEQAQEYGQVNSAFGDMGGARSNYAGALSQYYGGGY